MRGCVPTQAVTEELNGPVLPNERRVRIQPRNGMSLDAQGYTDENGERVIVATSGVNILIYNVGGIGHGGYFGRSHRDLDQRRSAFSIAGCRCSTG